MTRTPLRAASTAARAVSSSRISPIRSTSGAARSTARCASANVGRPGPFTATWSMPGSVRSIGSSSVITIRSGVLSRLSRAWAVVVLPDPGGPATSTSPDVRASAKRERLLRVGSESELGQRRRELVGASEPERDVLPVHRRDHGAAEMALLTADDHGDGPGLRHAPLGGDETRHRLQAARHRPLHRLRDASALAHDAVHTHADDEGIVLGIEVDVGRAVVDGVFDRAGDQLVEIGGWIGDVDGGGFHSPCIGSTLRER